MYFKKVYNKLTFILIIMVNVNEAFEVRYEKNKNKFEVLVDFDKLNEFRKNTEEISVYDVLADSKVFSDQKKGKIASTEDLKKAFLDMDEEEILKEILIKGDCQIPSSFLNKLREEKKKQVINYICENAINPLNKSKYTLSMIESEIEKIRYNFDSQRDFTNQAEEVIVLLKKSMAITISRLVLELSVPPQYCGSFLWAI
jgi:ribosome maturation protein SDO1